MRIITAHIPIRTIQASFGAMDPQPPLILTLEEAAALGRMAPATLKRQVSEGEFKRSVARGKPLRFFRDVFVQELMDR